MLAADVIHTHIPTHMPTRKCTPTCLLLPASREPPDEGLMCELLWSDPGPLSGRQPSKRGVGVAFGEWWGGLEGGGGGFC